MTNFILIQEKNKTELVRLVGDEESYQKVNA